MNQQRRNPDSATLKPTTPPPTRPSPSWRPRAKIRPCLGCGRPRISTSASDRLHPACRPAGELNDGEHGALVLP